VSPSPFLPTNFCPRNRDGFMQVLANGWVSVGRVLNKVNCECRHYSCFVTLIDGESLPADIKGRNNSSRDVKCKNVGH